MEEFKNLGVQDVVLRSIQEMGFEKPSDIQEKAIPVTLSGKDVIAGSATGSGKTLAFSVTIIQNCVTKQGIQALIMSPTRELVIQIASELKKFSKHKKFNISTVYGGVSINPQIESLERADIVVGTPGRLLDHLQRGTINLRKVKVLVLDEADRMLDMGFIEDVERIVKNCSKERQTLLFSATVHPELTELARKYMRDPVKISVQNQVDPTKLKQVYYDVIENQKFSLLVHLLENERSELVMVFCNSRNTVDFVVNNLKGQRINAQAIHGGFSQAKREKTISSFHSKKAQVLVCTDVAARGLDIKGVSHVYNYDIPKESKQYVHRIGRTARAGEEGIAINLLSQKDHDNFSRILRDYPVNVEKVETPRTEKIEIKWRGQSSRNFGPRPRHNAHQHNRRRH